MPATAVTMDMDVPRNGHFFREWQLTDIAGLPIDLTGHILTMDGRTVPGGVVLASATITVLEASDGLLNVVWDGADFDGYGSTYQVARAAYDLKDEYPDGLIDVPIRGYLNIIPEITA